MKKISAILAIILLCTFSVDAKFTFHRDSHNSFSKPRVWIISDGNDNNLKQTNGRNITDPDDVSALAAYLLMSNWFKTEGIVVASSSHDYLKGKPNQALWAKNYFGAAYKKDLTNLNKFIGGYQENIPFYESYLKEHHEYFNYYANYKDLEKYQSVKKLVQVLEESKQPLYILNWGNLTEAAVLVRHLEQANRRDLLKRIIFISHWTNSNFHVGTLRHPENTHNSRADAQASSFIHTQATNGNIKFYECGAIGQAGIVENSRFGEAYYEQFKNDALGKIFVEGKFVKGGVDDSDAATLWVLIGAWGVSLNDISCAGLNYGEVEKRNEEVFAKHARDIRNELRKRARAAAGYITNPVYLNTLARDHGLADPHVLIIGDTLFAMCGHDKTWNTTDFCHMDRWELWKTADLTNWTHILNIDSNQTYIGEEDNCWAGDLAERDGKFYWYFSNLHYSTGVMKAVSMHGPWKDALGKPLLPNNIIPTHRPYDPEIYVEKGVYTIFFGSGEYYASTLSRDMISLASKPKLIQILNPDGTKHPHGDKPCVFKRNGWYYLSWGAQYSMSQSLYGPYIYKGKFLDGGHGSVFQWHGQWYSIQENHETNAFYRGVQIRPLYFNPDNTVYVSQNDYEYPFPGRIYDFRATTQGWRAVKNTTLERNLYESINGNVNESSAIIASTPFLHTDLSLCDHISLNIHAGSGIFKVAMYTYGPELKRFTREAPQKVDWSKQEWITVKYDSKTNEYIIPLSEFKEHKKYLHQIAVQPMPESDKGKWTLRELRIE